MKHVMIAALGVMLAAGPVFAQAEKKMPAKPMASMSKMADALTAKEHALIDAVKARNAKVFSSMVAAGGWSVDENGLMNVDEFVKMLGDPKSDIKIEMIKASDMKVVDIDATSAIVTYKTEQKGSFMGAPLPPVTYVTTIWANQGGTWKAVFHQESTAAKR
ncbi:MAG TPA: nuclear transport factor 2 family protein [Vicinamibacterales bacterium]|jgi:hypothetical protein|nr:nuclear transport factor 2 family protein [Vicinamibacterales bacterium]